MLASIEMLSMLKDCRGYVSVIMGGGVCPREITEIPDVEQNKHCFMRKRRLIETEKDILPVFKKLCRRTLFDKSKDLAEDSEKYLAER